MGNFSSYYSNTWIWKRPKTEFSVLLNQLSNTPQNMPSSGTEIIEYEWFYSDQVACKSLQGYNYYRCVRNSYRINVWIEKGRSLVKRLKHERAWRAKMTTFMQDQLSGCRVGLTSDHPSCPHSTDKNPRSIPLHFTFPLASFKAARTFPCPTPHMTRVIQNLRACEQLLWEKLFPFAFL